MARPIPKSVLIHSAVHKKPAGDKDNWSKPEYDGGTTLTNVLFQPSAKLVMTKDNRQIRLSATMLFDCRNSSPKTETFALEDIIQHVEGETVLTSYKVKTIDSLSDKRGIHHYELGLM